MEEHIIDEKNFVAKFKELPLDALNLEMSEELKVLEPYCNKKIAIKTFDGSVWEGILKGYDMFQMHLFRNGDIEKFLLSDIDKIIEVKEEENG